jgi:hypothetical protein
VNASNEQAAGEYPGHQRLSLFRAVLGMAAANIQNAI